MPYDPGLATNPKQALFPHPWGEENVTPQGPTTACQAHMLLTPVAFLGLLLPWGKGDTPCVQGPMF